jgi:hypothetical protein
MHVSERLREAIYEGAPRGTGFLHAPKAAGTSVIYGIKNAGVPVVRFAALRQMHSPQCRCAQPLCRAAQDHEAWAVEGIRRGGPWLLDLGHWALTVEEAADIPECMPIVVPMRSNEQRIVSLFRFNLAQYVYGCGLRAILTPKVTFAWNPRRRSQLGRRVAWGHEHRRSVQEWMRISDAMSHYIAPDGKTLLWREWAFDAIGSGQRRLFWYRELLPGLEGTDDPRWPRLVRVPVPELGQWTRDTFGAEMIHVNASIRELPGLDLVAAVAELRAAASDYASEDREIVELLSR